MHTFMCFLIGIIWSVIAGVQYSISGHEGVNIPNQMGLTIFHGLGALGFFLLAAANRISAAITEEKQRQ